MPCRNEARTVKALVRSVRTFLPLVLVVNDGSTDSTAAEAAEAGARVLTLERNQGKGAAVRAGLSQARAAGYTWAVLMDGDGQHDPQDLPILLKEVEDSGAALVVGDRMHSARKMSWLRRQTNRWMSRWISARAGQVFPDSQCGYRVVNLAAWSRLRLETNHFEVESEMLLAFARRDLRVRFVPIRTISPGRPSQIHPLVDAWRWLRWWRGSTIPITSPNNTEAWAETVTS